MARAGIASAVVLALTGAVLAPNERYQYPTGALANIEKLLKYLEPAAHSKHNLDGGVYCIKPFKDAGA